MNQLSLDDFELFVQIALAQSLSKVARERNVAASHISRALGRIESQCGLRLAHRTTHNLSLTDEGEVFLEHAQRILAESQLLQDSLGHRSQSVHGVVRLSVSQLLAEFVLIPNLAPLREAHPHLQLDLHIADRVIDMADEGVDIAIRAGVVPTDSLVVRQLGRHGRALYAAPAYLRKYGTPRTPEDLAAHALITNTASPNHNQWGFMVNASPVTLTMQGQIRVDSSAAVVALALGGNGIARINNVLGRKWVAEGKLKEVLPRYAAPGEYPIYCAILAARHKAPKIRATMDFLQSCFSEFAKA